MSKVYILTDERNRIKSINSESFIDDTSIWTLIDEGEGTQYFHAQSAYLPSAVHTEDGIPRWKYDGECVLRTADEIEADRAARPAPAPTAEAQLRAEVEALNAMLAALLRGETEAGNAEAE